MQWWKIILIVFACLLIIGGGAAFYINRPVLTASVNEDSLPKFIQADFIDLSKVASISKFRSASGHDFSEHGESCRSMKHYYNPPFDPNGPQYSHSQTSFPSPDPATATSIMSPVDGTLTMIVEEHTPIGKQLYIRPTSNPGYTIRLFHVYPLDGIQAGAKVTAGQVLGNIGKNQGTDIAVEINTLRGPQFVSYFEVMPDSIFANYQAHGITNRNDLILTKAYRDSHPLQCTGDHNEEFAKNYQQEPNYDEEVYLAGYSKNGDQRFQMQQPTQQFNQQTGPQASPTAQTNLP